MENNVLKKKEIPNILTICGTNVRPKVEHKIRQIRKNQLMTKIINRLIILLLAALAVYFALKGGFRDLFGIKSKETTHHLILEETRILGKMELTSYIFRDIVEQRLTIDYWPDPRALLIVHGEAIGCIDLSAIQENDVQVDKDSLLVTLPAPELCSYKIDHSKSTIYDASNAFMNEAVLFEEAYKSAEKKLKEEALKAGILDKTKENAEIILVPLFEKLSGRKVRLKFHS